MSCSSVDLLIKVTLTFMLLRTLVSMKVVVKRHGLMEVSCSVVTVNVSTEKCYNGHVQLSYHNSR